MEDKIGIKDIIGLAMKGWKKEDILDLVKIANEIKETAVEPKVEEQPKQEEEVIDYKALYEESQKQLKESQLANVSQSVVEQPKATVDLRDIFR